MGLRFQEQKYGNCFFVTTSFKDRQKLGNIKYVYKVIADSLVFYSNKYNVKIIGYVFMPSHIHLLLYMKGENLSNFMRDFKKFISQKSIKELNVNVSNIWMPRYDKVVIYSEDVLIIKLNYIHNNPVKNRYVEKPEDWIWSSASDYINNEKGIIPIWKEWI